MRYNLWSSNVQVSGINQLLIVFLKLILLIGSPDLQLTNKMEPGNWGGLRSV